jgi:hypothetical protein
MSWSMRWPHLALLAASPWLAAQAPPPLSGPAPPPMSAPVPSWLPGQTAELALLDKVTARTSLVTVAVGGQTAFGTLSIEVARCVRRPPEEPAESAAWLVVTDRRAAPADAPFRGWMFATSPALNPLQHPVYDVRVIGCR